MILIQFWKLEYPPVANTKNVIEGVYDEKNTKNNKKKTYVMKITTLTYLMDTNLYEFYCSFHFFIFKY
jgi:hypothetical protein